MESTLRYSQTAKHHINAYLDGITDQMVSFAAAAELRRELEKLAANPTLGTAPTGPFETRPIYTFRLLAGDQRRRAQVSYRVVETFIDILDFSSVPV